MILKHEEVQKTNTIHKYLKSKSVEELEELKIYKCGHCNGTGIPTTESYMIWHTYIKKYMWDTVNFCEKCQGVGYVCLEKSDYLNSYDLDGINFICKTCNGKGCGECGNTGIVDWAAHIMGR